MIIERRKAVSLLSGGLDSNVATLLAMNEFDVSLAITFDYGQRAAPREIETARSLCEKLKIEHKTIDLPWLGDATPTALVNRVKPIPSTRPELLEDGADARAAKVWVPNRNGVFIATAAAFAESLDLNLIIAGFNAEEAKTFSDNSAAFVAAANAALRLSTRSGVSISGPLIKMGKVEIAERFVALNMDPEMFWCCYDGGEKMCGLCESCARTIRAFRDIGAWELISRRFEKVY
ncbi:MAG: 7-cyano-7-deazaguanine synthase QueC [Pseudomonadota bacterium]